MRMTPEMFDWLVEKVSPLIKKENTHLRKSIPPAERLAVTLRHFATGESQESLSLLFRIGQSTISGIIKETCKAIYTVLKDTYLKFPTTEQEWKCIAREFADRWNFHNCIGPIDGRRVLIAPPLNSASLYYNYKGISSIVLMAEVNANLRITYADVGSNGRISDRAIWNKCSLKRKLEENTLNIPQPTPLPNTDEEFPFVIVCEEEFTLSTKLLLPYPKEQLSGRQDRRIFNYRLSRARPCSENAFGITANRLNIFRSPMRYDPDVARDIVWAILSLRNLLRSDSLGRGSYTPTNMIDWEDETTGRIEQGEWRRAPAPQGVLYLGRQGGGNRHSDNSINRRNKWCRYFNTDGAVPWQERMI